MSDSGKRYTYVKSECPWDGCNHVSPSRQGLGKHFKLTHGLLLRDYERENRDGEYECPSCNDVFDTDRGVKVHHARAHGSSIAGVEVECDYCGGPIIILPSRVEMYDRHYCDDECRIAHRPGSVETTCAHCDKPLIRRRWRFETFEKQFCDDSCKGAWLSENNTGSDHPQWQPDVPRTVPCSWCRETLHRKPARILERSDEFFCNQHCEQEWKREHWPRGEDSPQYKGGRPTYYGPNWHSQRRRARERDGYQCQDSDCAMTNGEHIREHGQMIHVHHIVRFGDFDSYKEANRLSNLVTLCRPCHFGKWEQRPGKRPGA